MSQLSLKLDKVSKTISMPRTNSSQDLSRIIESIFKIKEKVIGVIDQYGKFYDIQFVHENLKLMKNYHLELVTAKDNSYGNNGVGNNGAEDNMSFASDNIDGFNTQPNNKKDDNVTLDSDLFQKSTPGFLGYINDIPYFEDLLLEDKKLIIVVCSNKDKNSLKIPYNFYLHQSKNNSVIIYYNHKKIGELYIEDWKKLQQKIESIIKNLYEYQQTSNRQKSQKMEPNKKKPEQQLSQISNKSIADNEMATEEIKNTFLQNLAKLREEQTISQLEYYKLKARLYENPDQFMRKYQMGTRQGFRKRKSIDQLRDQIVRSKEEKLRYQTIINQFKDIPAPSRESGYNRNFKNEIPIIVRKYNNVIQKISTSYPLNVQQEQAINLIMELQLKGLISQNDSRVYKSQILQQDPEIFALFSEYFQDAIDQIELAHRLKNKKRSDRRIQEQKNISEDIVRMIIKYAKRNSFELLRKMALDKNNYITEVYQQYQRDRNEQHFANSLEKVANYYRAKSKLEEDLKLT